MATRLTISISDEAAAALDRLAELYTRNRSQQIEHLIKEAAAAAGLKEPEK